MLTVQTSLEPEHISDVSLLRNPNTTIGTSLEQEVFALTSNPTTLSNISTAPGIAFESFSSVMCQLLAKNGRVQEFCFDTGSSVSLISEEFLLGFFDHCPMYPMSGGRRLRCGGIGSGVLFSRNCIQPEITMLTTTGTKASFTGEVHVVPSLPCGMLIATDIMKPNNICIKFAEQDLAIIGDKGEVPIRVTSDKIPKIKADIIEPVIPVLPIKPKILRPPKRKKVNVYATSATVLHSGVGQNLSVKHRPLAAGHSYLFEPVPIIDLSLGTFTTGIQAVLNDNPQAIPVANFGEHSSKIRKGQLLGTLSVLQDSAQPTEMDFCFADVFAGKANVEPDIPYIVDLPEEVAVPEADISEHWGPEYRERVEKVLEKHRTLFRPGLGRFNDGIEMPIPFKDESDVAGLKQNPFNLSQRDRRAMDSILNPLVEQGCVEKVPLGTPSAASSPAFVVWKNGKPRVVVDLRKVNTKLYPDAYPLPKQDTILGALGGSMIFSSVDLTKGFFQQGTRPSDWWKTTFVTPHRGQEWLKVSTMGLANTPGFFQHRMERLLAPYLWQFVLVYIDDVIIFSASLEDHVKHLDQVLDLLEKSGVTLSLSKCHFAYPSITALGHHVSRLGLSTMEEKVEAVRKMLFPRNLRELETGLGFFGYYRKFVEHYAAIARPLVQLKTEGFKGSPNKGRPRRNHAEKKKLSRRISDVKAIEKTKEPSFVPQSVELQAGPECYEAWETLKNRLCNAPTLAFPDFSRPFILYTDGSKEKGYGAALHQVGADGIERPILFLSRDLSGPETRYWSTELEAGALVWALTKLPQFFDDGEFTVVTDHTALKSALQNKTKGRRSARLDEWALYLSTFQPRMKIVHRAGKGHNNADGLSRLPTGETQVDVYPVVVVQAEKEFLKEIAAGLPKDPHFGKIHGHLKKQVKETETLESGPQATYQSYRLDIDSQLLYMLERSAPDRLCIPEKLVRQILEYGHDHHAHGGIHRTYDRLRSSVYFPKMRKVIQSYIEGCPACQLSKPSRQLPYGQLQPIGDSQQPLEVLSMDFVVGLPLTADGNNCLLNVTDKFAKFVRLIPGNEKDSAEVWATRYFDHIYRFWGIPSRLISDRDPKFTSVFWKTLFAKCGVALGMTTAYHPSADGQAERTNQTVETALRCLLVGKYEENWDTLLTEVEYALNTAENASTSVSPFEALYGVKPREFLANLVTGQNPAAIDFLKSRETIRNDTFNAIQLAQTKMAVRYDSKHRVPDLVGNVYLKLAKTGDAGYHIPKTSSLSTKRVGPYRILEKVSPLAYRLELPPSMAKVYPVISVIHLEQAKPDLFDRDIPPPAPIITQGQEEWVVERIVRREKRGNRNGYQVKWKGYEEKTWEPANRLREDVPEMVEKFEKARPRN